MRTSFQTRRFPWGELRYVLWFPVYLLLFFVMERIPMPDYWDTQIPFDAYIPFCEWFVIPYCLWYPLLIGVGIWLVLRDIPAFRRYMLFLAVTFFASELIWFLIPNGQGLRPVITEINNPLTALVAGLYRVDTHTNVFPSVHVVGSLGAAFAVWDTISRRKGICLAISLLAVLICLSTVFIKQHAVLDLISGVVLAFLAAIPVYHPILVRRRRAC